MNKYQEALNKLVKHIDFPNSPQRAFDSSKDEPRKYYIALQELVDKETPKKFKRILDTSVCCPNCNNHNYKIYGKNYKYCPQCGKKLDWSGE